MIGKAIIGKPLTNDIKKFGDELKYEYSSDPKWWIEINKNSSSVKAGINIQESKTENKISMYI